MAREKKRRRGGRGEPRPEWIGSGLRMLYSYCNHCPLSSPTHCHPGYPWATAKQLILLTVTLFFGFFSFFLFQPPGQSSLAAASVSTHNSLRWMRDGGWSSAGTQPMRRPSEALREPRSCILCSIIQYVLNKIGLVWVEE